MEKRKKRSLFSYREIKFFLALTVLLGGLVYYSLKVESLYRKQINHTFKWIVFGWNECDDYNKSNVTIYIRPHKKTTLIEPKDVCPNKTKHMKNKLLFLVFVLSAIDHYDIRYYIRQSWGSYDMYKTTEKLLADLRHTYKIHDYENVDSYGEIDVEALKEINEREKDAYHLKYEEPLFRVVFVLGKPGADDFLSQKRIDEEASKYNDIIQEDFVDTYSNLTLKTLMMMKWAINNCGNSVRYIMKSDDDEFLNMHLMIDKLLRRAEKFDITSQSDDKEYALFGYLRKIYGAPNRDEKTKHFVPLCYAPNGTIFPPYLSGASGYVMSMPVANALFKASWNTPYMNLEDIYVTGLLTRRSEPRISLEHDPTFKWRIRTMYRALMTCVFLEKSSIGSVDVKRMMIMHKRLLDITELQKCYLKIYHHISKSRSKLT